MVEPCVHRVCNAVSKLWSSSASGDTGAAGATLEFLRSLYQQGAAQRQVPSERDCAPRVSPGMCEYKLRSVVEHKGTRDTAHYI
eukprot:9038831-Prorocentrum_lima.AAC.1